SGLRDVHGYGATYIFWWGELNPATELPWTPADIADFGQGGSSFVRVRSQTATDAKHPRIFALKLRVHHIPIENRAAVGVWRRPSNLRGVLNNIATDALVTMPAGTPNWAKQSGRNYLFYWRESISPAMWSASKAEDVRWEGCYQDFRGTDGVPAGIVYPLHHSGSAPPPSDVIASDKIVYDHFGRPQEEFQGRSRVGFTMVPIV